MARLWTPTPRRHPDEWGAENRTYPPTSGVPGPRDPGLTPYMIPWIRESASGLWASTCLMCGAQMGKTESQLDLIGERLDTRPAPILYVGPSREFNTDQFSPRFEELLSQAPSLAAKKSKSRRDKTTLKHIAGVRVRLAHAGSSTALKSDPAALALVDEYDEMLRNVKGQGDPLGLVTARGDTHADFATVVASTPSRGIVDSEMDAASGLEFWKAVPPEDLESAIWRLWQTGTMHHWAWPCPHCGEYFVPRSKLLVYPENASASRAARETALQCPHCRELIYDDGETKRTMNAAGLFVARGQWIENGQVVGEPADTEVWSGWVSGLASPFVSWGERVRRLVEAKQSGDPDKIQTATNAGMGELFAPGGGDVPEWKEVLDRRRPYKRGTRPAGCRVVVAAADVQKKRILWGVRGFGARGTSWLLDHGTIHAPHGTQEIEPWEALQEVLDSRYGGLPVKIAFIDSGFRPGKPDLIPENMVYEFCRRNRRFVFPTKGKAVQRTPIKRSNIEVNSQAKENKYGLELLWLDTDHWKSWVHERVRWPDNVAGAWYLHQEADEDYARQVVSEARTKGPAGQPVWVARSRENHYLDVEAMLGAAGYLLNVQHLKGDAPPEPDESAETPVQPAAPPEEAKKAAAIAQREKFAKMAARYRR